MSGVVTQPSRNDSTPIRVFSLVTLHPSDSDPASVTAEVIERPDHRRFELLIGGELVSFATYSTRPDGRVVVPHVETRLEHRGNGHAARLMDGMLGLLRSSGRTIEPLCPFAASHIRSDARHHDLLAG